MDHLGRVANAGTVTYTITDLGSSVARAINDAGQVAGASNGNAVIWKGGVQTVLGSLGGDSYSYAINKAGQIVGYSNGHGSSEIATIWNGTTPTALRQPDRKQLCHCHQQRRTSCWG